MHLLHADSESPHAVEDLVGRLHPSERGAALVVGVDVLENRVSKPKNRSTRLSHEA